MEKDLINYWIGGFIAGEGCFGIYKNKNRRKSKNIIFALEVNKRDKKVIENIRKQIGCGNILINKNRNMVRYYVGKKSDIQNILIPFCDKFLLTSYKYRQYIRWKKKVEEYYS